MTFRLQIARAGLAAAVIGGVATPTLAQECPARLSGAWTATFPAIDLLRVRIRVEEPSTGQFSVRIKSSGVDEVLPVWMDGSHLRFQSAALPIAFDGRVSADGKAVGGFLYHASNAFRVHLSADTVSGRRAWSTSWTALGVTVDGPRFDLYIDDDGDGGLGGYFFFRDQRLPSLWGEGVTCRGDSLAVRERNLDLHLAGTFDQSHDRLMLTATGLAGSAPITFERMPEGDIPDQGDAPIAPPRYSNNRDFRGDAPPATGDGWRTGRPAEVGIDSATVADLVRAIADGDLPRTHSVLVARHGRLAVEEYFYGFDRQIPHDMRSASKSVTSTLIGLAIRDGYIADASAKALSFFPRYHRFAAWDPRKADITIRHLLTMSSGLDANDSDPRSVASENAYQSQSAQPDWIKLALDAPMVADPGTRVVYGGANPLILGGILAAALDEPVEWFAHRTLFQPLGIREYKFFLDPTGVVYMGGGLYLRPRDMLKYGQLHLNGGMWQGARILPEEWIRESWGSYGRLEPLDRNGHEYGYLWWHHQYDVDGQTIATVEARGNGGQYIFVVPSLDMVVVVTAGNYRGGLRMTRQPEVILQRYVLPAVLRSSQ